MQDLRLPHTDYIALGYLGVITNTEQCLHQLIFALKLKGCIEDGRLTRSSIDVNLSLDATDLTFDAGTWDTQESMIILAENHVNMAVAALAIAADEELDRALGPKNPLKSDFPFNLRAATYQIRNCFAHNLLQPKYQIKGKYRQAYELGFLSGKPVLDFTSLNGEVFSYQDFGGFNNFWSLFQEVIKLILNPGYSI